MSLLLLLSPEAAPAQISRRGPYRPRRTRTCVAPPASGLALDNTTPAAVRSFTATTDTAPFSPPASLLLAFAIGDANNGSLDEQLTVTSTGGLTWTLVARGNGSNGGASTVEIWKARAFTPPGSIVVTATDNKGAVAKSLAVQVIIDLSGRGVPDTGAVAFAAGNATYVSTAPDSWGWAVGLGGSNASTTAGAGQVVADSVSGGGFDSGDNIWTIYQQYLTAVQGTSVTMSVTLPPVVVHNVAVEVVPFTVPLPPAPPRRGCRMPAMARRTRTVSPPWTASQTIQAPAYVQQPPARRRPAPVQRRPRPVLVPPVDRTVFAPPDRRARPPILLRRRPALVLPAADQPTIPVRPRARFLTAVRRGRTVTVVPAQVAVAAPAYPPANIRSRLRGIRTVRGRTAPFIPDQILVAAPAYPPSTIRTRLRGIRIGRGRATPFIPDQIAVAPPAYTLQPVRTRLRGVRLFRGRTAQVVPAQVAVAAPAYPPQAGHTRFKGIRAVRGHATSTVPPQELIPSTSRTRQAIQRAALLRRGHTATAPVPQGVPPLWARARARLTRIFRGRSRTPVPPQIVIPPPVYVPASRRTRRVLVLAARQRRTAWTSHYCTVPRPSSGTTPEPSTGITQRPNTGVTTDPC